MQVLLVYSNPAEKSQRDHTSINTILEPGRTAVHSSCMKQSRKKIASQLTALSLQPAVHVRCGAKAFLKLNYSSQKICNQKVPPPDKIYNPVKISPWCCS